MNLRTELHIPRHERLYGIKTPILTVGSCFSETIGQQLFEHKFEVLSNPFGTAFNPVSIEKLFDRSINNQPIDARLFVQQQEITMHYDYHSNFWGIDQHELQSQIEVPHQNVRCFLEKKPIVVLTFGTAFVYEHKKTGQIVANCHKTPATAFEKKLLTTNQTTQTITQIVSKLAPFAEAIVLTVSPVRHTRDSLPLNQVSKSTLRIACHDISEQFECVSYFPSYEIMMDDLRDYRFYKSDLIHPNELAEAHIFSQFLLTYFDNETQRFVEQWKPILASLRHKPMYPNTQTHRKFLNNTLDKLKTVQHIVDVREEIAGVARALV